jgi:glutaredoxin
MSNYYIYAVLLQGCQYSNKARELLDNNNIKNIVEIVTRENKEKFKMENYSTYPQIFLRKENSKESLFFGGYTDLQNFIDIIKNNQYELEDYIINFQKNYNGWSRKAILRLIELII